MKTILFIEDESTLQKTVGQILEQEGYEIKGALDGETGLALAKREKPDLILLDLILPKLDGFEVLKGLKQDEATRSIPVIILTNLNSSEDKKKGLSLGADDYLAKSEKTPPEVLAKVEKLLGKK